METSTVARGLDALRAGRAYADLSGWRKVLVAGPEARSWLNDLLSADIADLAPGGSRRSLLLSPTGRIRADVAVANTRAGLLLIQDAIQPEPIDRLLEPYVLSSDVTLDDRTEALALLAFPEGSPPSVRAGEVLAPSCLGPGADLVVPWADREEARAAAGGLVEVSPEAVEARRIERGVARFGVDLREDSLPHEAALDHAVGYHKGCFLGQEAVAKVRNLGHPPFVVLAVRADGPVAAGEHVRGGEGREAEAGIVTSAAELGDGRAAAIVRVRWAARDAALRTAAGTRLESLGLAAGA